MRVLLYRPSLSLMSGAGQLIAMQARGLAAAGADVTVLAQRGAWKFFFRTGVAARSVSAERAGALAESSASGRIFVDHAAQLPAADVTFVHNLVTEASRFVAQPDWAGQADRERAFFTSMREDSPIVANSALVKAALVEQFALDPHRILVHYPGYRARVFARARAAALRDEARRALGVDTHAPLIGLVTSGDFRKRGLDVFVGAARLIAARRPEARFLVVGSRRLPEPIALDPLHASGRLVHVPKNRHPERWLAALDVLLYTALFEEFGIVVSEAQALGVPVLTSRRVGAAECLPPEYTPWILDTPSAEIFAERALALLADGEARHALAAAGAAGVQAFDEASYVRAAVRTILDQKR